MSYSTRRRGLRSAAERLCEQRAACPEQVPPPSGAGRLPPGSWLPDPSPSPCRSLRLRWSPAHLPGPSTVSQGRRGGELPTVLLPRGSSLSVSKLTEPADKRPGGCYLPPACPAPPGHPPQPHGPHCPARKRAGHPADWPMPGAPGMPTRGNACGPVLGTRVLRALSRHRTASPPAWLTRGSPWIWSMIPRSLRSTSRRFSRSCRPMRRRLRSSKRSSAEAFTSSTPWLAGRVRATGTGPATQGPGLLTHAPPRPSRKGGQAPLLPAARQGTEDRCTTQVPAVGAAAHPPRGVPGGAREGDPGGRGRVERLPAGRLAPVAAQQQQHSQQHERRAGPVEAGAAVTVVQEAASPHLLGSTGASE